MLKVGLTGGISTGKTTVGRMFVSLGCRLIDADAIARQLLQPGQAAYEDVVRAFGSPILRPDGTIDRKALGDIVFNDPERRKILNNLVHPPVIQREKEFMERVQSEDPGAIAIVDAALMIEVGTYKNYEKVIVVVCPPEEQKRRLIERAGLSDEEAEARIRAQMPLEEKVKVADFVIDNSGSVENTSRQVEQVYRKLASGFGDRHLTGR